MGALGHVFQHVQGHILGVFRPGLLPTRGGAGGGGVPETFYILLENGNILATEGGDRLIKE